MHYNTRQQIIDLAFVTIVAMCISVCVGFWSYKRTVMLENIMDCMPAMTEQSYDVCYTELYGEDDSEGK